MGNLNRLPAGEQRREIVVVNSRFIACIQPAFSVEEAREYVAKIKSEYPDATHHVPAFIIGWGSSIITHCNDDGEPSGTAGRPALMVLQGSGLGNVVVVVVRYFGGTKLGTGGLVRAYTDAVKAVLENLPLAEVHATQTIRFITPYSIFERIRQYVEESGGLIRREEFGVDVTIEAQFPEEKVDNFRSQLQNISNGKVDIEIVSSDPQTIFPISKKF